MKILISLMLLAFTLPVFAQSNRPPLTAEQRAVIQAAQKIQMEEITRQLEEANAKAQQQALERKARMSTNVTVPADKLERRRPPATFYVKTNQWYLGLGIAIQNMEQNMPGSSTNFSPAQKALTNLNGVLPPRPW